MKKTDARKPAFSPYDAKYLTNKTNRYFIIKILLIRKVHLLTDTAFNRSIYIIKTIQMKKLLFVFTIMIICVSLNLNAQNNHKQGTGYNKGKGHKSHGNGNGYGHSKGKAVGAPLDGGLLIALGAAGTAYFIARKKKENQ
jgi:hypothetical protein